MITQTNLFKNSLMIMTGNISGKIILIFSQILLARLLGPYDYGLFILGWTILRLSGIFSLFGVDKTIIFMSGKDSNIDYLNKMLTIALTISLFVSLISSSLIYLLSSWFSIFFLSNELNAILPFFALINFLYIMNKIFASSFRAKHKMINSTLAEEFIQPFIFVILILFMNFYYSITLNNILLILLLTFFITFLYALLSFRKIYNSFIVSHSSFEDYTKFIKHSLFTFTASVSALLILWVDRIMIGRYCDPDLVGIYQVCSQSLMIFSMIIVAIALSIGPSISQLYHADNYIKIKNLLTSSVRWTCYICLPLIIGIILKPDTLILVIFGNEYVEGTNVLLILVASKIVHIFSGAVGYFMVMTNNQRLWTIISFITLFLNIILNFFLIPNYKLVGAALSSSMSLSLLFLVGYLVLYRKNLIDIFNLDFLKVLISFFCSLIFAYNIKNYFSETIFHLIIFFILIYIIYLFLLYLMGYNEDDKAMFKLEAIK